MVTESNGIWMVPLGDSHQEFSHILFHRRFASLPGYTVIVVDTEKFMQCFERDNGFVVKRVEDWDQDYLERKRNELKPSIMRTKTPEMPIAHLIEKKITRAKWFGLLGKESEIVPVVAFTNGRHRSRYLQYAGAKAFPVEVEESNAALMSKYCGWKNDSLSFR